ncbi:autotransporter outer membrane beta-barrel domain-containing protein [Rahnella inusitata]|uniref:autotransporter outer membrane beta-barrel domain-containing protein n=1 Tax=Rahnella inusitata TaxID=58169 RepID=UPI0039BE0380
MHTRLPLSKVAIAVLAVIGSPTVSLFSSPLYAVTLQAFNPVDNDQLNGNLLVTGGAVTELTGNQQFAPGVDGSVNTTLGALQGLNRIVNDHGVLGANRLDIGPANFGITIPDATTGGNTTFQVYNPASLVALAPIDASTSVADVVNVQDNQYINTRIADVNTGGTLNVNIGKTTSAANAATNAWTMAAKQSTLFNVDGTSGADSTLNWNSNNRITFTGTAADPTVPRQLSVQNLMTYNGAFTVQTVDGATNSFNVTNAAGLKTYNDWLITQLKSGNLDKSTYLSNFNKAFIRSTNTVDYLISADDPTDDVAQSIGNRIVINATGANAKVNVAAGKTLEVIGANGGAIRGSNGAEVTVNGKVSSSGSLGSEGSAVYLDASSATNNGVINGGFINRVDGTGVGSAGFGSNGVQVQNGSTFDNNGIVNFATTGGTTAAVNLGAGSAATNSGNINVGVNGSSATGSTSGVLVGDATASFINNAGGMIYIGRGPQNSLTDSTADTAVNQSGTTAGVQVTSGGSAINNGSIVLGSRIQNGAGMLASGGTGITMLNNGNIDVTGKATAIPRENIAMSVLNASGNINNAGIINLTGVNATGVKVVATQGNTASATSTGTINVAGGSDPASGTRNYGVWVEGQGTGGTASASVDGPVNLTGNGAIGVHARGNATVDVASTAIPTFSEGSNQIGFFAFGPNAKINSIGNNAFDVTTTGSTMFRLEQGADFDGTNLTLTSSGANSVGVLGTGTGGTVISSKNATFEVSGNGATGMVIEGGATGSIDTDTTFNLSGTNAVAAIADGQRHTLAGTNTGSPVQSTALTSAAVLTSAQNGLTGYIARNRATLTNSGDITFTGAGATGLRVETGATGINTGNISVNDGGAGIMVNSGTSGLTTTATTSGTIDANGGSIASRTRGVTASGAKAVATLSNGSMINLNGVGALGAEAIDGATVNIASTATPTFNNTDQIAYRASGAGSTINSATSVLNVDTDRSTLYRIADGATLTLGSGSSLTASGTDSMALVSTGANARINTNGTRLIASGTGARAVTVEGGAQGNLDMASSLTLSGTNSIGGVADGQKHQLDGTATGAPDASTTLTSAASLISSASGAMGYMATNLANVINNGVIALSGAGSSGMTSQLGGTVTSNNQITLTGADSTGLSATQNGVATNNSALILSGANSTGISATQNGIVINNASVDLSGIGSTAARLSSGSTFSNNGTLHVSQGTGIDASGDGTSVARAGDITVDNGIAGVRLSDGTQLVLTGTGNNITTSGTAHGVLLDTGAAGLSLYNTTLNINGTGSGIENRTETGNVTLQNTTINVTNGNGIRTATSFDPASTLRVNVNGSGTAFNFTNADLSTTSGALTLGEGYVFNVTGAGGTGINANTTGDIVTSATVNVTDTAGGSALVAGTAGTVLNTGVLTSASLSAPVVDLSNGSTARFENRGIITPSSASAVAVSGSAGNDDVLLTSGNVFGDINTGAGDDTITWNGGTLDGSLSLGAGNANRAYINNVDLSQTRHITSGIGEDNQVSFSQIVSRGGTFDTDDLTRGVNLGNGWNVINFVDGTQWELTGDLKLAHSNVNIDSTSTLFAGNGVNPTISGGEVNSAIVTNAGLIDLTNGSGSPGNSLTINGDLVSDGGTVKMITNLNEGGVLSNQFTDSLRITGNASSGTTLLDLTAADVSTGKLTDLNHSSTMDAYEGISLVQVGGNASAGSFALKGGYLAAGPWRYDLYSFAPGASDANQREVAGGINNTFWDYRIGNAYVCQGDDCNRRIQPAAVTPTNPGTPEDPSTPVDTASTPLTNPPDDGCVVNGIDNCAPGRPAVTPQVPSYISAPVALAYYNASIIDDLHKRLGELRHEQSRPDGTGGEMFLRYIGSNMTYKSNVSFKQFGYDFDMDYSAVQVGGNVLRLDGDKDSLRGGLAYTHGNSRMRPKAADGFSSTTFDSDSIALYLTWQRQNGFYMDGVLSFDNHRGQTDIPRQQEVGSPKAKSWSASLESGYPFLFDNGVKLEPQAQLMYTRINMDNFTDKDSTTVDYQDYSQTIGRAGLRADRTWIDETGRQYTPYLRANYYRGWGGEAKTTIGAQNADISQTFASGKFGQMGELGGGGTITFKNHVSLYAEVDYRKQINSNGAKGWGYTGGVRWTF